MKKISILFLLILFSASLLFALFFVMGRSQTLSEPYLSSDQKMECVSYTPFRGTESPSNFLWGLKISNQRLDNDISLLSQHFSCVRVYSATGLEALPEILKKYNMQLLLGIWIGRNPVDAQKEISKALTIAGKYPEVIKAIIVGNEALLRKDINGIMLSAYIRAVKAAVGNLPVTYADVWEFWQKNPEVAPSVDFITIHILPYWENDPASIDNAIKHVAQVREAIVNEFPGKDIFIGETGWPSFGRQREGATPSLANQARFIRGFVKLAEEKKWHYNLIEAFDQPWKRNNEGGVGGYWGFWDEQRHEKESLKVGVSNLPHWRVLALSSMILSLALVILSFWKRNPSRQNLIKNVFCIISGSFLLVLQSHQYIMLSRDVLENIDYMRFIYFHFLTILLFLFASPEDLFLKDPMSLLDPLYKNNRLSGNHLMNFFYWTQVSLILVITTLFIFESRYRMYPTYGFMIPALFFGLFSKMTDKISARVSLVTMTLMIGLIILTAVERISNTQALGWCLVIFFISIPIIKSLGRNKKEVFETIRFLTPFKPIFLGVISGLLIRFLFLESAEVTNLCSVTNRPLWCGSLSVLGVSIYFRLLPKIAFIFLMVFFFKKRKQGLFILAQFLLGVGLVLYSVDLAALVFLFLFWDVSGENEHVFQEEKYPRK